MKLPSPSRRGWLGLALLFSGILVREWFQIEAQSVRVFDAYEQGASTMGNGAPMNMTHGDWPLPESLEFSGWLSAILLLLGAILLTLSLIRMGR